jgi:hypothetical protein
MQLVLENMAWGGKLDRMKNLIQAKGAIPDLKVLRAAIHSERVDIVEYFLIDLKFSVPENCK